MAKTFTPSEQAANLNVGTTEQAVANIWAEVLLSASPPSTTDDFFSLGGDSVAMTTILFRIKEEFSVELEPTAIFSAPTVAALAARVDAECAANGGESPMHVE